jgi:hypothetical protein
MKVYSHIHGSVRYTVGFFRPKLFLHMSLSIVSSSVGLLSIAFRPSPSISRLSSGLSFPRVPSASHSRIVHGSL